MTFTSADSQAGLNSLAGKYLTFSLSKERYGLEILKVQEIIGVPNITRVPRCPDFIKGVINLRGKIIPLVDLRLKFMLPPQEYNEMTCIVVVNITRGEHKLAIGVIVDTVLEVLDFQPTEIEQAPDYGAQVDGRFIMGMGRKSGGELNILINIEKALDASEQAKLEEVSKA